MGWIDFWKLGNILDTLQIYICIMTVVNLSYMIGNIDSWKSTSGYMISKEL